MKDPIITTIDENKSLAENLKALSQSTNEKIVFSTSFGKEDQVIAHTLFVNQIKNISLFTLGPTAITVCTNSL